MRKPNIELNKLKLAQREIQLEQIIGQIERLNNQLVALRDRRQAKMTEISALESKLTHPDTDPTAVSE